MANGIMYVDGIRVPIEDEKNVLEVIYKAGIEMPNFCFHSDLSVYGACRMCMVEDEAGNIEASCTMKPRDGLRIRTNTKQLLKHRKLILELLLSAHCRDCTTCQKNRSCRLQSMAVQFGIQHVRFGDTRLPQPVDDTSPAITMDMNKCILCGDCVRVCSEIQGMNILQFLGRGPSLRIGTANNQKLAQTHCVSCGQCAAVCTTGAITLRNEIGRAWRALHDPKKRVVVQVAPAVRVAIGEAFGIPSGENCMDRLVSALKIMGADEVFDTNFGADLTVMEEADEFVERLKAGGPFPMFTSCCPAWVKFVEKEAPQYLERNLSSCKSPISMLSAFLKDRYAQKDAEDGRETFIISVAPCTAKKMEVARPELTHNGKPDTDLVLTTQEVINMIRETGIRFERLEWESADMPYGMGTGAGAIFGTSGGVAEAVIRRCIPDQSRNGLREVIFAGLRGDDAIRTATVQLEQREVRVAVAHGLASARELLRQIEAGEASYDLVEVMACRTGCVGGAGQPQGLLKRKQLRANGLHEIDRVSLVKRSQRNPVVQAAYSEGLQEKAHELLHVRYGAHGEDKTE